MGKEEVKARLFNHTDLLNLQRGAIAEAAVRKVEVVALVDTGATYVVIPRRIASQLGPFLTRKTKVRYADGREGEREKVFGLVIEVQGRQASVPAIVEDNGAQVLIGYVALEDLDFAVDTIGRRLIPGHPESPDTPMADEM
ncbi:MAG: retroviral-like aspartic protease [Planctomycetes bacterium]|nr:retroviral-like aspartic protease [Planctomycetota bacterium]